MNSKPSTSENYEDFDVKNLQLQTFQGTFLSLIKQSLKILSFDLSILKHAS